MRSSIPLLAVLALSACAVAPPQPNHAAHHPPAADAGPMDTRMKSMKEMHEKMMAASTPAERQALMAEHMKAMQDTMAMMGHMKKPSGQVHAMPMGPEMMGKRMDMMEMMMQMMLDREAIKPPAVK